MPRPRESRRTARDEIDFAGKFCRVVGVPIHVTLEHAREPEKIDHVWIVLEVPGSENVRVVVNTMSVRNQVAGFDSRIRLGILREPCTALPAVGVWPLAHFDYAELEARENIYFEQIERREMELLLLEKANRAVLIESWGEYYGRGHRGLHQIHSRRASCAVAEDIRGRDGALRFYFDGTGVSELLLFKFCGQP